MIISLEIYHTSIIMTVDELYNLVEDFYGYKIKMLGINSENKEVEGILYDSFLLRCNINDRYGRFGAGIQITDSVVLTEFLGKQCSLNSDEKSIKESLEKIDDYCRMRLPDKYLNAYYKTHNYR